MEPAQAYTSRLRSEDEPSPRNGPYLGSPLHLQRGEEPRARRSSKKPEPVFVGVVVRSHYYYYYYYFSTLPNYDSV